MTYIIATLFFAFCASALAYLVGLARGIEEERKHARQRRGDLN